MVTSKKRPKAEAARSAPPKKAAVAEIKVTEPIKQDDIVIEMEEEVQTIQKVDDNLRNINDPHESRPSDWDKPAQKQKSDSSTDQKSNDNYDDD